MSTVMYTEVFDSQLRDDETCQKSAAAAAVQVGLGIAPLVFAVWRQLLLLSDASISHFNVRQKTDAHYSYRPSVRHTLVLCHNGSTYRQTVFTAW